MVSATQACALTAVTVAVENACAESCKDLTKQVNEARKLVSANN